MSWKDKLGRMFGAGAPPAPPGDDRADPAQRTHERLDQHWSSVGALEADVLGHLISPGLMGGPSWPTTRQAYRVVRRSGGILLVTDGMSDPFDGDDAPAVNGFGMELFLETPDIPAELRGEPGDISRLSHSWAFELLSHVAGTIAGAGGIVDRLEQYGALSMELPGVSASRAIREQLPAHYVTADDSLGILLGAPAPDFAPIIEDMPLSPVHLVPLMLLTADELEYLRQGGGAARMEVARRLADTPHGHRCVLARDSVAGT